MMTNYRIRYRGIDFIASTLSGLALRMRDICMDHEEHIAINNDTLEVVVGPCDAIGMAVERVDEDVDDEATQPVESDPSTKGLP